MVPARYAALAAVVVSMGIGGGVAYAATGSGTTTTPGTSTTPSTTAPSHSKGNCPNMGGNSGSSSSGAAMVYPSSNL